MPSTAAETVTEPAAPAIEVAAAAYTLGTGATFVLNGIAAGRMKDQSVVNTGGTGAEVPIRSLSSILTEKRNAVSDALGKLSDDEQMAVKRLLVAEGRS